MLLSARRPDRCEVIERLQENRSSGPATGEVKPQSARRYLHSGADLEQTQADRVDARMCERRPVQHLAPEEHQKVVGERMKLESKGVGSVRRTRQTIGRQAVLELLDEVPATTRS